jgi:hypothetical protein
VGIYDAGDLPHFEADEIMAVSADCLRMFARLSQTKLVFFGGSHDNGYSHAVLALETEGLTNKIVILKGSAPDIARNPYLADRARPFVKRLP